MVDNHSKKGENTAESGNVLFLILLAVVLFAALSYAITQSSRSTGNDPGRERTAVIASQIVEQPAAIRMAITRMIVAGVTPASITLTEAQDSNDVFYSTGGGASFVFPPTTACVSPCTTWIYKSFTDSTHGLFVGGVKSDAPEIMAILNDITPTVCPQIQKGLGFTSSTPPTQDTAAFDWTDITGQISQAGGLKGSATTIWEATLTGQEFACIDNHGTGNIYYHVLLEQ